MKVNRHAKIIELINKYHIETQEELAEYLNNLPDYLYLLFVEEEPGRV